MTQQMIQKTFKISYFLLTALIACLASVSSQADTTLQDAQAAQAQGLTRFYQNIIQNPNAADSEKSASFNTEVGPANAQLNQVMIQNANLRDSSIFNKVYLPNGARIEPSQYDPNEDLTALMARYPASKNTGFNLSAHGSGDHGGAGMGGYGNGPTPRAEEPALDGSKIPKEIDFAPTTKHNY
jgi:hypothetical protein